MVVRLLLRRSHSWIRKPARLAARGIDFLHARSGICGVGLTHQQFRSTGPDSTSQSWALVWLHRWLEHLDQLFVRPNHRAVSHARLSRQQPALAHAGSERHTNSQRRRSGCRHRVDGVFHLDQPQRR